MRGLTLNQILSNQLLFGIYYAFWPCIEGMGRSALGIGDHYLGRAMLAWLEKMARVGMLSV